MIVPYFFSFTVIALCIVLTQVFRVLGKRRTEISASDFAALPYSFGVAGITANAVFIKAMPTNKIMSFDAVIIALLISFIAMASIAQFQRMELLPQRKTQIWSSLSGFAVFFITYTLWIVGSL